MAKIEKRQQKIQKKLNRKYKNIAHINSDEFSRLDTDKMIIFDVRTPAEFAVSYIENSIQIDPRISTADFLEKYASAVRRKTVVFYCSVGYRSTILASRVQDGLLQNEAIGVYNLSGGIFQWHNEERLLLANSRQTNAVHPYSKKWGKLILRQDKISYRVRP